ncbi:hypothetical protein D4R71_04305 [bacterium]|nr:MAG: hypothetical protein D4R71_04305 [bacterium]
MNNELVMMFEDNPSICDRFEKLFIELKIELKLKTYNQLEDFKKAIYSDENYKIIKVLIFDLAKDKAEERQQKFEIESLVNENYHKNRIPIFIHSGFIELFTNFSDKGTVFKIEKSADSMLEICNKIKLMEESGFLNIFCINGLIEGKIMEELHKAFTEQFKNNEIEEIIKSIKENSNNDLKERTIDVFERIAVRSLYQSLMSAKKICNENIKEVSVNSVEHYYRRTSKYKFWTGDIFQNKNNKEMIIILTPQCNISNNNYDELLLCKICPVSDITATTKKETLRRAIVDDVKLPFICERWRYLVKTPLFEGGKIDFTKYFTLKTETFLSNYNYVISTSEELSNDIVRKFSSYLLRSGISVTEINEAFYYIKNYLDNRE